MLLLYRVHVVVSTPSAAVLFQIMHDYKLAVGNERVKKIGTNMKALLDAVDQLRGSYEEVRTL